MARNDYIGVINVLVRTEGNRQIGTGVLPLSIIKCIQPVNTRYVDNFFNQLVYVEIFWHLAKYSAPRINYLQNLVKAIKTSFITFILDIEI